MKTKLYFSVIIIGLFFSVCEKVKAQTNVSGGIFANTTWTLANSPYIVTGNVVVFPGFTLTIEPGVIVKFDNNQQLEIRQSTLIAEGTATDSIIFTSDSITPMAGVWSKINFNGSHTSKLSYCSFSYAFQGILANIPANDSLIVKHSSFYGNNYGMSLYGKCILDSCNIFNNEWGSGECSNGCVLNYCSVTNNQFGGISILAGSDVVLITNCYIGCNGQWGIYSSQNAVSRIENCIFEYGEGIGALGTIKVNNCIFRNGSGIGLNYYIDTVTHCLFQNSAGGLSCNNSGGLVADNIFQNDSIAIFINNPATIFLCNTILNSIAYAVRYTSTINGNSVINNYWGTTDSTVIASLIYDGYDNASYGLLTFMPVDTAPCPNIGPTAFSVPAGCGIFSSVNETISKHNEFKIYPNPATNILTISLPNHLPASSFTINDMQGRVIKEENISQSNSTIQVDVSALSQGVYLLRINGQVQRFVKM